MNQNSMRGMGLKVVAASAMALALLAGSVEALAQNQAAPERARPNQPERNNQAGRNQADRNQGDRANRQGNREPGGDQQRGEDGGRRGGFGGMMGGMTGPAVSARQVEKYNQMLGLSAEQKAAVKMLYDGYAEQARETGEKVRTQMEGMRDQMRDADDRGAMMEKMQASMREVRATRKAQDDGFTSDVKSLLTPEQIEKWPTVERMQRRESSMRRGFVSGERVDLTTLLEDPKLSDEGKKAAREVAAQYEEELDRELIKRNKWQERQMEEMGAMRQNGDMEAIQKMIEEGRAMNVKVRDVNRKYAKAIENALPEGDRQAFAASFKAASFPDVYRTTPTTEALKAADSMKDLSPDQQEGVKQLMTSYEKSLNAANDKLAAAVEEQEMQFDITQMGRGRGQDEDSPVGTQRRARRDLDRTTLDSLKKILTPEQAAKLPKRDDEGGRGRRQQN